MIDINAPEFIVLVVLAVIIFGPEKLPELARKGARVLNYVRNIANDAQGKLRQELGTDFADLNISDLNPRALITSTLLDPVKVEVNQVRATVTDTVAEAKADLVVPAESPQPVPFDPEAT
jgi:sec-independent protein translocase protein TatB